VHTAAAVTGAIYRAPYDGLLGGAIGVTTGHGGTYRRLGRPRQLLQALPYLLHLTAMDGGNARGL